MLAGAEAGGRFVDVTDIFRKRSGETSLTVHPTNYHLNQQGIDLLFDAIRPKVLDALDR